MPPKRRGRPSKNSHISNDDEHSFPGLASTSKSPATPSKKTASAREGKGKATSSRAAVPDVYQEMLLEALPTQANIPERPLKRRRTGKRESQTALASSSKDSDPVTAEPDEDEEVEFEDVLAPQEEDSSDEDDFEVPKKLQQTAYRDSDESGDEDFDWDGIDFDAKPEAEPSGDLELTLVKRPEPKVSTPRRKVVTKADRVARLEIHKMHVLCLLSYLDKRNEWINDPDTKYTLRKLLDKKVLGLLRPSSTLSQFRQTDLLKAGLEQVSILWRSKFQIIERGMRRALWAEDEKDLENYTAPADLDSVFDKSDFREAAKKLKGSRDLGTLLFCSLLRSADVETRIVCSIQPLSFNTGGPPMPKPVKKKSKPAASDSGNSTPTDVKGPNSPSGSPRSTPIPGMHMNPRSRLGHPNAADYFMPELSTPSRAPQTPKPPKEKVIRESGFPVFWVEVFDEAHQKWLPVDPLVTETVAKPSRFEPWANDRENSMTYVIAFEEEGCARDVTRRYTKAYNAKTRKSRVESTPGGEKWWKRAMRPYRRGYPKDSDAIEDAEFVAAVEREPMPRNIQDFKDHPVYALERHLRRNEVLINTRESGKVAAGRDPNTPGGKKMESIFRRRDVRIARSADAWYRLGRDIKMGEHPVKTVAPRKRAEEDEMDDEDERAGTNLYTEEQTELCAVPPVVNGRIPKNRYGNLDLYVPTMVPPGGVHIPYAEAQHAARIVGVDYADAVTGFEFRGRHGTAVIKGVVVAAEYREAVEAVVEGLRDEQARAEEAMRSSALVKMWKRFLISLRIKERVKAYAPDADEPDIAQDDVGEDESDVSEYVEDGEGGGFFPE